MVREEIRSRLISELPAQEQRRRRFEIERFS
jgi:hypothetical protein